MRTGNSNFLDTCSSRKVLDDCGRASGAAGLNIAKRATLEVAVERCEQGAHSEVHLRANAIDEFCARVDRVYKGNKATDLCVVAIEAEGDSF